MCGIAGRIGLELETTRASVQAMANALAHRGPDGQGLCVERFGSGYLALGHRRLSVIDLSSLGDQPMSTPDQSATLVFNGEIYNFQSLRDELTRKGCIFRSTSDTEVLMHGLALQGPDFVKKLEGMYAFAYFDRRKHSLLLCRDPAGIKPLYYSHNSHGFFFASEIRAILATGEVENGVSRQAVTSLLAYGAVPQPLSIIETIRMLEPGKLLEIKAGEGGYHIGTGTPFWEMPQPMYRGSPQQAIEITERLLSEAVRDHLIADVPVGVFLSAGIDSTLLASLAYSHSREVRAFTVALSQDSDMDEMGVAAETAARIGIEHVPVVMTEACAEEAAFEWLAGADQPSIDGLNTFIISRAVRAHGIKVAISGLGADELFGGYPSFRDIPKIVLFSKWLRWLPEGLRLIIAHTVKGRRLSFEAREKLSDMLRTDPSVGKYAILWRRIMSDRQLRLLGFPQETQDRECLWLPAESVEHIPADSSEPGWTVSKIEMDFYQRNTLLRDSDANSMANSLEIRVPFLDQRLLNWVPSLPDSVRFPGREESKYLLRHAGKRHLDNVHLRRPKTGFTLPLHRWLTGPMRKLSIESLEALKASSLVDPDGVEQIWSAFLQDRSLRASSRVLALVTLGAWLRQQRLSGLGVC